MFTMRKAMSTLLLAVASGLVPTVGTAGVVDTVNWAPDASEDGTSAGTLAGGTIAVTDTTSVGGPINAGEVFGGREWSMGLGTAAAAPDGTTFDTGASLGEFAGTPQVQTLTLSQNVVNPILFFNFDDPQVTYNFGALALTVLASNNAQFNGGSVSFLGSANTVNDGFAVQVTGTFGPNNSISFQAISTVDATQTVTIGIASVPEPSSFVLAGTAVVMGLGVWTKRRRG